MLPWASRMSPSERDVHLADGRTLRVLEDGDPRGRPVFYLHGTPGSRVLYEKQVQDARRRGIRLIGYDRPGYGRSTPKHGRRVADAASDVLSIADALGLDRFAVYGHSGGGPHALACGTLSPRRTVAIASLASCAPYPTEGLDWLQRMGAENVDEFSAALKGESELERFLEPVRAGLLSATPEGVVSTLGSLLSPVDSAALTGELVSFLVLQFREGLREGILGQRDDDLAFVRPWGFETSDIKVPVQIWQGGEDRMVPFAHGEWLASRLPQGDIHLEPKEGHLSLVGRYPSVHEWLGSHF
jgi:pimeloyl-ACP methyl ester carboxylesterase